MHIYGRFYAGMRVTMTQNINKECDYVNGMSGLFWMCTGMASMSRLILAASSWSSPGQRLWTTIGAQ
eukprot:735874-Amphidinium_carterae.1